MKFHHFLFSVLFIISGGMASAQDCSEILGVWKHSRDYLEFKANGEVDMLPAGRIFARWECVGDRKVKIFWPARAVEYTISANGKKFFDGESSGQKVDGRVGRLKWKKYNGSIPNNAIRAQGMAICKCNIDGGTYSGKVVNGKCVVGKDGMVRTTSRFEILTTKGRVKYEWVQSDGWKYPSGTVSGGKTSTDKNLSIGAVNQNGQLHPGWIAWETTITCHAGVNNKEVTTENFKWLSATALVTANKKNPKAVDLMNAGGKKKEGDGTNLGKRSQKKKKKKNN